VILAANPVPYTLSIYDPFTLIVFGFAFLCCLLMWANR
jgi:hypothetical protein